MIRIKSLKMKAFRSFAEEAFIEFPESGLALIRGANETNHDSSGTGKSTILLAVAYALDMCPFPASELQSWSTEESMQVQLTLTTPLGVVVINRGKRNSLKIGNADSITGAKAIAEGVRKLFGLDSETLRAITYRAQNTSGLFLDLTDSEKKEFLTRILGLDSIEKAVEVAEGQVRVLIPALATEESAAQQLELELAAFQAQVFPEQQDVTPLLSEIEALEPQLAEYDLQIKAARARGETLREQADQNPELLQMRSYLEALRAKSQEAVKVNSDRHRQFQTRQEELRRKIQEITRQEQIRVSLSQQIETINKQLQHALDGKCPTCFRTWDEATTQAQKLQATIDNYQAQLKSLGDFTAERKQTEASLREAFVIDPIIEQFRAFQSQLEAQLSQKKIELTLGPQQEAQEEVNAINLKRTVVSTRLKSLGEQVQTISVLNQKLNQTRQLAESTATSYQTRLGARQAKAAELRAQLNAEKDFLALMGRDGFLGVIFDDVLSEIESEANERLGKLANVSHVTIQFKSEIETQKGTVQKKITPVVFVNGVEARLRSGLSGGMYTSVEGVVDLAVMSVVQRRTGSLPGFLFLDESFNGQGNATKEAAMEVLREYGSEKLVVVIDHNSEFKEMFSTFINVRFKDGRSEIV